MLKIRKNGKETEKSMAEYCFASRRRQITTFLQQENEAEVPALVKLTGASEATIRRDLLELERQGVLVRTYGGAKLASEKSLVARTFGQRDQLHHQEKQAIAAEAVKLIQPGMTIVLDSGTTCRRLAAMLIDRGPLQILTTALAVVDTLGEVPDIKIILCGGIFRLENLDFVGNMVDFSAFHADYAFLGCDAMVPGRGFFAVSPESAAISSSMVASADHRIILADHTKFRQKAGYRFLTFADTDAIYTDSGMTQDQIDALKQDCRVVCCS